MHMLTRGTVRAFNKAKCGATVYLGRGTFRIRWEGSSKIPHQQSLLGRLKVRGPRSSFMRSNGTRQSLVPEKRRRFEWAHSFTGIASLWKDRSVSRA